MWFVTAGMIVVWFILKFLLHKSGFVHILLLTGISMAVVQWIADGKTRYHKTPSGR